MGLEMFRPPQPRVIRYLRVWKAKCPSSIFVFPAPRGTEPVPETTVGRWPGMFYEAEGWRSQRRLASILKPSPRI
jgi:hypothetical protein